MINKKIAFDTLEYETLVEEKGVANPEAHAASLATVIAQNLYMKDEVDKMIEATFQRFDKRFEDFSRNMDRQWEERRHDMNEQWEKRNRDMRKEWEERTRSIEASGRAMVERMDERTRGLEKELHQLDKNIQSTGSRTIYMTVSILGALIAVVGAAATFTHYFVH